MSEPETAPPTKALADIASPEKMAEMRKLMAEGKANPSDLFAKLAEGMIAEGLKSEDVENQFVRMALADIMQRVVDTEAAAVRIEAKLNLLSGKLLEHR